MNGLPSTILSVLALALVVLACLEDQQDLVDLVLPWRPASPYLPCYLSNQAAHSTQATQPDRLILATLSVQIYQAYLGAQ